MPKVDFSIEVQLLPLVSIISAPGFDDFRVDFQSFSESPITFAGREYEFIDSSITELHSRQAQFSTVPQRMIVRNAPIPSQRGDLIMPGLSLTRVYAFSLETPLDLTLNFDGLRRCSVQISYVYRDADSNLRIDRRGRAEIVESKIMGSEITYTLGSVLKPNTPIGLIRTT